MVPRQCRDHHSFSSISHTLPRQTLGGAVCYQTRVPLAKPHVTHGHMHGYAPKMVRVLGGHADPQRVQDTLSVGEAERARW